MTTLESRPTEAPACCTPNGLGLPLWYVVVLDGELDLASAHRLVPLLMDTAAAGEAGGGIVTDLARVEFCDSAGLAALVAVRNHLRLTGQDLVLRNPSATVAAMVDLFYGDGDLIEAPHNRKNCG